jgi:AraC-like DNA-binding protein
MPGTPRLVAETPPAGPLAVDLLSEVLRAVRLTGAVFLNGRFTSPFGVVDPRRYDERLPMARLRHVSVFHLVVAGSCEFESAGQRCSVAAGDLIFMPQPDVYRLWSGAPDRMAETSEVVRPGSIPGVWVADHGGGGLPALRLVCGFIESADFLFAPVFRGLPAMVVEHTSEDRVGALIASTVGEIVERVDAAAPGSQLVLGRLMELLFVELLRHQVQRSPAGATGWFAALNDPVVARALHLMHTQPAERWTVDEIAHRIGSSRSVLAERFKALLGRPPIDYLAAWRIQLAAERLRSGDESVPRVAENVGYESEAAFGRAFKRLTGISPGRWRETGGQRQQPVAA